MKRNLQIIVISLGVMILFCGNYLAISEIIRSHQYENGIVLYKSEQLRQSRHCTNHYMMLTVKTPTNIRDVSVTTYLYMTSKIGDQIKVKKGWRADAIHLVSFMVFSLTAFSVIALLVFRISDLFYNE